MNLKNNEYYVNALAVLIFLKSTVESTNLFNLPERSCAFRNPEEAIADVLDRE